MVERRLLFAPKCFPLVSFGFRFLGRYLIVLALHVCCSVCRAELLEQQSRAQRQKKTAFAASASDSGGGMNLDAHAVAFAAGPCVTVLRCERHLFVWEL